MTIRQRKQLSREIGLLLAHHGFRDAKFELYLVTLDGHLRIRHESSIPGTLENETPGRAMIELLNREAL